MFPLQKLYSSSAYDINITKLVVDKRYIAYSKLIITIQINSIFVLI
jgi:hypothetical protein